MTRLGCSPDLESNPFPLSLSPKHSREVFCRSQKKTLFGISVQCTGSYWNTEILAGSFTEGHSEDLNYPTIGLGAIFRSRTLVTKNKRWPRMVAKAPKLLGAACFVCVASRNKDLSTPLLSLNEENQCSHHIQALVICNIDVAPS